MYHETNPCLCVIFHLEHDDSHIEESIPVVDLVHQIWGRWPPFFQLAVQGSHFQLQSYISVHQTQVFCRTEMHSFNDKELLCFWFTNSIMKELKMPIAFLVKVISALVPLEYIWQLLNMELSFSMVTIKETKQGILQICVQIFQISQGLASI